MAQLRLGRTRVLANPVARSGRGAAAAERVQRFFDAHPSATTSFSLSLTKRAGHAGELASTMDEVDTLIVLGGDGIIHEAVNGLMRLPHHSRPDLAVIPMGSGASMTPSGRSTRSSQAGDVASTSRRSRATRARLPTWCRPCRSALTPPLPWTPPGVARATRARGARPSSPLRGYGSCPRAQRGIARGSPSITMPPLSCRAS